MNYQGAVLRYGKRFFPERERKEIPAERNISRPCQEKPTARYAKPCKHIRDKYKGNCDAFAKDVVAHSIYSTEEAFTKYLNKPSTKVLDNDMIQGFCMAMYREWFSSIFMYWGYNEGIEKARKSSR